MLQLAFDAGTAVEFDAAFRFAGGRALCPDGVVRSIKRIRGDAAQSLFGCAVRCAIAARGHTVTGSVLIRRPELGEPANALEFVADPDTVNAGVFV